MIRADFRTYVLSKSSVTDLIDERMYVNEAPEGASYPRIVYREGGGQRTGSLGGANGQVKTSFTIECQAATGDAAIAIADALANILEFYQGLMDETVVQGVFVSRIGESIDAPIAGDEPGIRNVMLEVEVWYESPVPTYE